ncbi:MAG: sugar transferase [Propionibacteriales bacterium]|nr:sugar transferase [Propionibacteriales bacterium]
MQPEPGTPARRPPAWKRAFDLLTACVALAVLSPVLAVVSLLVRRKLGSPVLFSQLRPGLGGEPFRILKFRTMTDAVDASGQPLPDDQRLTPFGAMLRRTSLDELPELINVLKGDMSIVGPRPLLMQYLPLYSAEQFRRHELRPGITGYAQVRGRNAISWEEKFAHDVEYVDRCSLPLDLRIILETVVTVFRGTGVSQEAMSAGMEPFRGNAHESDPAAPD